MQLTGITIEQLDSQSLEDIAQATILETTVAPNWVPITSDITSEQLNTILFDVLLASPFERKSTSSRKYSRAKYNIAAYLDSRSLHVGPPKAEDLPTTLNSLEFVWKNFLKNNLKVLYVKQDCMQGPIEMQGLYYLLNTLTPPEQSVVIWQDTPEVFDMFLASYMSEETSCIPAPFSGEDTVSKTSIAEEVTLSVME